MTEGAREFATTTEVLEGWSVRVTVYRIGATHHCRVDDVDPGATIARASGASVEEARAKAMASARSRLASTNRR